MGKEESTLFARKWVYANKWRKEMEKELQAKKEELGKVEALKDKLRIDIAYLEAKIEFLEENPVKED